MARERGKGKQQAKNKPQPAVRHQAGAGRADQSIQKQRRKVGRHLAVNSETGHMELVALSEEESSGWLPPAEELAKFQEIDPKLVERIVGWVDEEIQSRRDRESAVHEHNALVAKRGSTFGFIIGMTALILGAAVALYSGSVGAEAQFGQIGGSVLGAGGLATLIWGPPKERREYVIAESDDVDGDA